MARFAGGAILREDNCARSLSKRCNGRSIPGMAPTLRDVPPTSTFYDYVVTAYKHGIITGYEDGTFRPGNSATRGQISEVVYGATMQP